MLRVLIILLIMGSAFLGHSQTVSTYAGTGTPGFTGDGGPSVAAQLNKPYGIVTDDNGNVYFADQLNKRIRKIDNNGIISTLIDTTDILNFSPSTLDYYDNALYFLTFPSSNFTNVTKYDLINGDISLIKVIYDVSANYKDIAVKGDSVFLVKEVFPTYSIELLNISLSTISELSSSASSIFNIDYKTITDLEVDTDGNLLVISVDNFVTPITSEIVKLNFNNYLSSSVPLGSDIEFVEGISINSNGEIFIVNKGSNNKVFKVNLSTTGSVIPYAGAGPQGDLDGDVATAKFNQIVKIAIDNNDIIYVSDFTSNKIKRIGCTPAETPTVELQSYSEDDCPQELYFYIPFTSNLSLNDNQNWMWYGGIGCGDIVLGAGDTLFFNTSSQDVSFFVRGEGDCATSGVCKEVVFDGLECIEDKPKDSSSYLSIFSAFSPNKDGVNDVWVIDSIKPNTTVLIFNRWGDLIKKIDNYDNINNVWDGTSNVGVRVSAGTYFYAIESNNQKIASGWVEVVR